jgi:hypothetical protein
MKLRLWKKIFITPFIRLNLSNGGLSISFGHRGAGWLTLSRRGLTWTANTGVPGLYVTDSTRWKNFTRR